MEELLDTLPFTEEEREEVALLLLRPSATTLDLEAYFNSLPQVLSKQASLLLHASKCLLRHPTKDLPCPVFPQHCAAFQNLFFHLQACPTEGRGKECTRCGNLKQYVLSKPPIAPIQTLESHLLNDLLLPGQVLENAQIVKKLKLARNLAPDPEQAVAQLLFQKEQHGCYLSGELLKLCQGNRQKYNDLVTGCLEQLQARQPRPIAPAPSVPPPVERTKPLVSKPPAPTAIAPQLKPIKSPVVIAAAPPTNASKATTSSTTTAAAAVAKRLAKKSESSSLKRANQQAQQDKRKFPLPNPERRNHPFPQLTQEHLDHSFLNWQSHKDVVQHISSLARYQHKKEGTGQTNANSRNFDPTKNFRLVANNLLRMLSELPFAHVFRHPVDPVALGLEGYFDIVKHPMDLSTIKQRLESKVGYGKLLDFAQDVRLMFDNAILFNTLEQDVGQIAAEYGALFEQAYYQICQEEENRFAEARYQLQACNLCAHSEDFLFEPPVFICDVCDNKIKRDSLMYVNTSAEHRVCRNCFKDQPGSFLRFAVTNGTSTVEEKFSKSLFKEQKNNQQVREEWVICFYCRRKSHAICAMAKTSMFSSKREHLCAMCLLRYLEEKTFQQTDFNAFPVYINLDTPVNPPGTGRTAKELPTSPLSRFVEQRLRERIAQEPSSTSGSNPGLLSVRVVLNKKEDLFTREGMLDLYGNEQVYGYPKSFPTKQKCLLLFEEIDGFDVLLFVMYVQYFGSDAPHPNKRSMYISYLDSVNYFSQRELRTVAYQEIVISLLEFERQSGYVRCFIWSCPPANGDDYIFHVHPKTQRIPDSQKLRHWYFDLLEQARQRNIVFSLNTLFDEYICRVPDVRFVPYFDGDWVNVYGEFFIKNLKNKDLNPLRRQNTSEASRNTGTLLKLSEQEISMQKLANKQRKQQLYSKTLDYVESAHETCAPIRPLLQVPIQDVLTAKILTENEKMRKDFIVVKMCQECAECAKHMDQPNELHWISPQYDPRNDPHDYRFRTYAAPYCLCHECYLRAYYGEYGNMPEFVLPALIVEEEEEVNEMNVEFKFPTTTTMFSSSSSSSSTQLSSRSSTNSPTPGIVTRRKRNHGDAENLYEVKTPHNAHASSLSSSAAVPGIQVLPLGVTAKPPNAYLTGQFDIDLKSMVLIRANVPSTRIERDLEVENTLFDKRRGFVSKCQEKKWQFDELRRAKHSTQSILDLLHHPDAEDEYIQTCSACQIELKQEYYSCNAGECEDFDLCSKCYATVQHPHPLVLIRGMELKSALAIMDHMKTCIKALSTTSMGCDYCSKMKRLFLHFEKCSLGEAGGCGSCRRFVFLLSSHVKQCRDMHCTLPNCSRLKQQYRRKQQGDDDRRVMSMGSRDAPLGGNATEVKD
ncbi:hypothetical protein BASA81_003695 [Batrachochytrium salamandrivorans]|nr:hypothetical protein BASA81_003695 [Batrachochytrium salamandrivorans]